MRALPDDQTWVLDLVSPDDARRSAALVRHRALLADATRSRQRADDIQARQGWNRAAENTYRRRLDLTLDGLVTAFCRAEDPAVRSHYAPYAVLFLRWEERFPADLRTSWPCSPWTTKERVLRDFTRGGVPAEQEPELAELLVVALRRPYRCKDWRYAGLLRHLAPAEAIAGLDDDRARFARHVLAHPELTISRFSYPRWLAAQAARPAAG
ncbi:hypothetical protein GCM10020358_08670 [Amorphoplanes nipponensis]|uniref:Uncharacterized protein n=1 Tax=Actinoplanes nipponensis TaxID=135950 RepID=A0A919MGF3_9ACTN|nr:hypothetical protein [Actinoplanes nipponensis]GIE48529.1 hypothetical protein Ani05nite_20630 [Actinoplanes nipponensis]